MSPHWQEVLQSGVSVMLALLFYLHVHYDHHRDD